MPGMPFHLEKGHALMALEDLVNDASHHGVLTTVFDGLRAGTPMADVFEAALASAPTLDHYAGHAGPGGLGDFVRGAWFGQAGAGGAPTYWLDYQGDVDGIVREALLYALETAWGVDRSRSLPARVDRSRRVELWWHCAQRWFDAWIAWSGPDSTVTVLFATPPHTGGNITDRIDEAVAQGLATSVQLEAAATDGDLVLVCQERNEPSRLRPRSSAGWSAGGQLFLPPIGRATVGSGPVGAYTISAHAGGVKPRTVWK